MPLITAEKLIDLYWNQNYSVLEIAQMYNVTRFAISHYFQSFNIPSKSIAQSRWHHWRERSNWKLRIKMDGPGCSYTRAVMKLSSSNVHWLREIQEELKKEGIRANLCRFGGKTIKGAQRVRWRLEVNGIYDVLALISLLPEARKKQYLKRLKTLLMSRELFGDFHVPSIGTSM